MKKFRLENNKFLFTNHAHSAFAQVNLIFEEAFYFQYQGDSIVIFSSDVSQRLNVGGTTLTTRYLISLSLSLIYILLFSHHCFTYNRYHQKKSISLKLAGTPPHDFCTIGHIHPYGYLEVRKSQTEAPSKIVKDVMGREHIDVPHSGNLQLILRSESPNIQYYINDIVYLLKKNGPPPSFFVNCSDRGSGWDLHAETTFIFFGRMWKDLNMTGLCQMSTAEGMSAFNKIERKFSQVHDNLCGVEANDKIDGQIPKKREHEARNQLLNEAMNLVCEIENRTDLVCEKEHSYKLYDDLEEWKQFFNDNSKIEDRDERKKQKVSTYNFLVNHAIRTEDFLLFFVCLSTKCEHCQQVRKNTRCPLLMDQLDYQGILLLILL